MNKKLKDWYTDNHGDEREKRVKEVFSKWYKRNLVIVRGEGRTVEDIFGLPYTSSSDFAALWNCQAKAYYKDNEKFFFEYLAITDDFNIVVGLQTENEEITQEVWIGRCIVPSEESPYTNCRIQWADTKEELDVTIYAYDCDPENPRDDDEEIFYYGLSRNELMWLELTQEVIDDFRVIEVYQ